MRIIISRDYDDLSRRAANLVAERLRKKPDLVLGLVAGSTPVGLYHDLVDRHRNEGLSFARVRAFAMDEYVGLPPDHPRGHLAQLREHLLDRIDIPPENIAAPEGTATDVERHCQEYEERLRKAGGIDLQLLGIGRDGHIGFNEPGSSLASHTRRKALGESTIADNSRFFEKAADVPRFVITMGVGTIISAREILLLAAGRAKAEMIARTIEGPITNQVTASILQIHPRVTVIIDEEAAGSLEHIDFYRYIQEQNRDFRDPAR